MKYRTRIYYTETAKAVMWDRWQKCESPNSMARHFGRSHSSIQGVLVRTGGIRPPRRRRSRLALTLPEREETSRGVVVGRSRRSIATTLGRAPSTVNPKILRNGGQRNSKRSSYSTSGRRGRCVARGTRASRLTVWGRSPMRFPFVNGQPRLKTEPCPATGKVACCLAATTVILQRWWNVTHAT